MYVLVHFPHMSSHFPSFYCKLRLEQLPHFAMQKLWEARCRALMLTRVLKASVDVREGLRPETLEVESSQISDFFAEVHQHGGCNSQCTHGWYEAYWYPTSPEASYQSCIQQTKRHGWSKFYVASCILRTPCRACDVTAA